jgi:aerobic carbon-monoxide dehydrogenase medium subunit
MYRFDYQKPTTLSQATGLIASGAQALAGGQTLLASMKQRLIQPESLVDLAGLPDMAGISETNGSLRIGAMTRHAAVASSALVRSKIPALATLAGGIGDRQVRAMGTIGGSVANNDPSACYPSALLALGATVVTNQRSIAAEDFFQGMYATALEPGELITAVQFPMAQRSGYAKFKQPASRYAVVGVFVAQTAAGVRVAVTGAANGVFRHAGLEAALTASFSAAALENVQIDASDLNSDLHASAEYRAQLIRIQTQRAVEQALG